MSDSTGASGTRPVTWTVTAVFDDPKDAQAAVSELRGQDISPSDISITIQDWRADDDAASAMIAADGIARQEMGTSGTYRVSQELPNDEDLSTTEAYMVGEGAMGSDVPVVLDPDIPPDEPLGGGLRLGIRKTGYDEVEPADQDMVRRNDASEDADEDIYTDFPDQPGGLNPDSPEAREGAAQESGTGERGTLEGHSANSGLPPARGEGATVTISVDDTQRDFVQAILEAHGGKITST